MATTTAVVLAAVVSGTAQATDVTLIQMGFDPDRAQLIMSLVICAIAAAAVTLVVSRTRLATTLGACSLGALFGQTFVSETQNAIHATGIAGNFDPGGWVLTLVTLVAMGFVFGWAGATLAAALRPGLVASGVAAWGMVGTRPLNLRLAKRPIAVILVASILLVTLPAFGDMVNLTPDSLMLGGNGQGQGLVAADSFPIPSPTAGESAISTQTPSASPSETPVLPTKQPTAAPGSKPWLAWKPTGSGHVTLVKMAAPWVGGSTVDVNIYTPPGYEPTGERLYPVMYEAPTGLTLWNKGTSAVSTLDSLIDSGAMPAAIVVFIDEASPPISPSECVDTANHQQWLETYISGTVVSYVDRHFRTMSDPQARGIMGMSEGGFCAPMLMLRHPDVFRVSVSFSGYFWAGGSGSTNSARPFLGSEAAMSAHSPAVLVSQIPEATRSKLYFILIANPSQGGYGPGADTFGKTLGADGYRYLAVESSYSHGWDQVRYESPGALEAWGAQLVINGIW